MAETENGIVLTGEGVTKRFGELIALKSVDFEIRCNEVLGIVGENGSGKSTLTKILVGAEKLDSGRLILKGQPYAPKNPFDAERAGIFIVYQESALVPDLKVYQWMFLGRVRKRLWQVRAAQMKRETDEKLREMRLECSSNDMIRGLNPATRKMVEIGRAFLATEQYNENGSSKGGPLIILDEPTAAFSKRESELLFGKIRELRETGTFVFISHILPEVLSICDRLVVLRDGNRVGNFDLKAERVSERDVQKAMLGRELGSEMLRSSSDTSEVVLKVEKISKEDCYDEISFELKRGQIVAITGPIGQGKSEIGSTIAGIMSQDSGSIIKNGTPIRGDVAERLKRGIGYFSGDNREELFYLWPIYKNMSQPSLGTLTKNLLGLFRMIDLKKEDELAQSWVQKLKVRPQDHKRRVLLLSGGNKQKVAIAKWMAANVDLLVMENPTMGIDIGAREELYGVFHEFRSSGRSVILITDDLLEAERLADHLVNVEQGRITSSTSTLAAV